MLAMYISLNCEMALAKSSALDSSHLCSTRNLLAVAISIILHNNWVQEPGNLCDQSMLKAVVLSI